MLGKRTKWDLLPQLPNSVLEPQAFFLCGKLYCLGGHEENKPWAMACKSTLNTWESLTEPPSRPSSQNCDLFSAAMEGPRPSIACRGRGRGGLGGALAPPGLLKISQAVVP